MLYIEQECPTNNISYMFVEILNLAKYRKVNRAMSHVEVVHCCASCLHVVSLFLAHVRVSLSKSRFYK